MRATSWNIYPNVVLFLLKFFLKIIHNEIFADGKVPVVDVETEEDMFAEDAANNQRKEAMEEVVSDEDMFAGYDWQNCPTSICDVRLK